jgi:uncharacterized membrane protein
MMTPNWLNVSVSRLERSERADRLVGPLRSATGVVARGRRGEALRGEWLGHALHPLATDLPLGCWISSTVLDIVGGRSAAPASRRLVGMGLVFLPLTALSGMADWNELEDPPRRRVGAIHAVGNTMVALVYLTSWRRRRDGRQFAGMMYGLVGGVLAFGTGYLGGHLSFARGSSVEPRGLREGGDFGTTGDMTDLLTVSEVADELGATVDRVRVMVDEGLLMPAVGGQELLFRRADLVAVRLQGG